MLGTGAAVTWSFAASNFTQLAQRYSGYKSFDTFIATDYRALVVKAVSAWEAVANIDLIESVDSSSVNIRIGNVYIDGVAQPGQGSTIGATQTWRMGGTLVAAEVYFDADAYLNNNFYEVAVHEIGHALGFDHSSVVSAVMYYSINSQNRAGNLTADDAAGAAYVYGPLAASMPVDANLTILKTAFASILRIDPGSSFALTPTISAAGGAVANPVFSQAAELATLAQKLDTGALTTDAAVAAIGRYADATTSVATLAYQFFTGRTPTNAGLDYLVHSSANPNDLNDPYYAKFNIENRYINFAVNLGKLGEGKAAFAADYGKLSLAQTVKAAYAEIFGTAPTDSKVSAILDGQVMLGGQAMSRAAYLALYGGDGSSGIGTKAAAVGFLLVEALKAGIGPMAEANAHFLADLADGSAQFNVDLMAVYPNVVTAEIDGFHEWPDGMAVGLVGHHDEGHAYLGAGDGFLI